MTTPGQLILGSAHYREVPDEERCWADRWSENLTMHVPCPHPATTRIGLCDLHHAEIAGRPFGGGDEHAHTHVHDVR